jgi:hypothetical protein
MANLSSSKEDNGTIAAANDLSRPFIARLQYDDGTEPEYSLVHEGEVIQFGPHFCLPGGVLDVTIDALIQTFFPPCWLLDA